MKRLGAGSRVSGGWLRQGGQMRQDAKRAVSNVSGLASQHLDVLNGALSLLDGMTPGGPTQNSSLCYKRLERPAHRVSGERQNVRYFFC